MSKGFKTGTPDTDPARNTEPKRPTAGTNGEHPVNPGRRRFSKGALAAPPILLTLYGRPLFAGANCTPSGWVSGNTSLHHELVDCGGNTPGYWQGPASKEQVQGWRLSHDKALDDPIHGLPGMSYAVAGLPVTLQQAVEGPGKTPFDGVDTNARQLLRFGTAALLNARYQYGYQLSETQVITMVSEAIAFGAYTTPSGDVLTARQVKDFLDQTMNSASWGTGSSG